MRISRPRLVIALAAIAVTACSGKPDNGALAQAEADQIRTSAAEGRVECALAGATIFRLDCSMDRIASAEGTIIVLGRPDAGYRRFRITTDGRGLVAADGAEPAVVTVLDRGMIEVRVAQDRYRVPATIKGQ